MIVLRIDDVGRREGDKPEQGSDGALRYFDWWRGACGLIGTPAIYGAVPAWLEPGAAARVDLQEPERWSVHGYDHTRGADVSADRMRESRLKLQTGVYIPPFNAYTRQTVLNWSEAGGSIFLGGYEGNISSSCLPSRVGAAVYMPACKELYGRASELVERIPATFGYPLVLTLHVPWETDPKPVRDLVERIRTLLVPVEKVLEWL
jgi:hypothetical protein